MLGKARDTEVVVDGRAIGPVQPARPGEQRAGSVRRSTGLAERRPTFGATPMTCTETLPISNPASRTSLAASRSSVVPDAPAHSGRPVPKIAPRSPRPAADSSASQIAWAATSPSECPASPSTPSHLSPATQHSRPFSNACTSVPLPINIIFGSPREGTTPRARS